MNTGVSTDVVAAAPAPSTIDNGLSDEQLKYWHARMGVVGDSSAFTRTSSAGSTPPGGDHRDVPLVEVTGRPEPDDYAEIVYYRELSVVGVFAALRTPATTERTASLLRRAPDHSILVCSQISAGGGSIRIGGVTRQYRHPSDLLMLDYSLPFSLSTDTVTDPVGIWIPTDVFGRGVGSGRQTIDPVWSSPLARAAGAFIVTLAVTAAVRGADIDTETELAAVDLVRGLVSGAAGAAPRATDSGVIVREAARALIRRHFRDPTFSAADLAAALHMSRRNLYRRLAEVGTSPAAMIADHRLERAAHLLGSRQAPVIDHVAKSAGFSSPATLRRNFRSKYGVSPDRYRRDHIGLGPAATHAGGDGA